MHRIAVKPSTSGGMHRRGEQSAEAGEHHQAHHARLGQREEVAPIGGQGRLRDSGGHDSRAAIEASGRDWNPPPPRLDSRHDDAIRSCSQPLGSPLRPTPRLPRNLHPPRRTRQGRARHERRPDRARARPGPGADHDRRTSCDMSMQGGCNGESFYRSMKFTDGGGIIQGGHHQRCPQALPGDRA